MVLGTTRYVILIALAATWYLVPSCAFGQESSDDKGYTLTSPLPQKSVGYRESWALVIGVNYEDSKAPRHLVPALKNAENDAKTFSKLLMDLYGYRSDHVILLTGKEATQSNIGKALSGLKDNTKYKEDDSVIVFFSGHGTRLENIKNESGAIYAADVEFSPSGKLMSGYLQMHLDISKKLHEEAKVKHKLLILDCCHSGEIFSIDARSGSKYDRQNQSLFEAQNSLQAIASCRDRQRASDGNGTLSPFTGALVQALKRIPAREGSEVSRYQRIGVNQLFTFMLPELAKISNGQSPDCRSLAGPDGEFSFFPSSAIEAKKEFNKYVFAPEEFRALQAMVPGDHGKWWFEEKPWFIPSLRLMILKNEESSRSGLQSAAISDEKLSELADGLERDLSQLASLDNNDESQRRLMELRLSHFRSLRSPGMKDPRDPVKQVVSDLESLKADWEKKQASPESQSLPASDLHLLAVCKHYLQRNSDSVEDIKQIEEAYKDALAGFNCDQPNELTMKSLCHADYGHFLSTVKRQYKEAADQYHESLAIFGSDLPQEVIAVSDAISVNASSSKVSSSQSAAPMQKSLSKSAPAAFRVYVLCAEANAWLQQNRWGKANSLFEQAFCVAAGFDEDHELMVFVLNQRAWAQMAQWKINNAQKDFEQANKILLKMAQSAKPLDGADGDASMSIQQQFKVMLGNDYTALARHLHHLHGLAMAKRFMGKRDEAISDYREIIGAIAMALEHCKNDTSTLVTSDVESTLLTRLVNSQERLADCSLFGNPAHPDLQEAADDYRRALNACSFLAPGVNRENTRMSLLYKLALALSIPSPAQDIELAQAYCTEARVLMENLQVRENEPFGTLGLISEAVVAVFAGPDQSETRSEALSELRLQIHRLRDELGGSLHRDQLETLLLGVTVLVNQDPDKDRYHLTEDTELLLYLCRLILPKPFKSDGDRPMQQEACSYLHNHYDTAFRSKLRMKPAHVKDLIELQWEATRGVFYTKPTSPLPILALYLLDDKCYLLLDMPSGISRQYCLEGDYYVSALKRASVGDVDPLPLPSEIQEELIKIAKQNEAVAPPRDADPAVAVDAVARPKAVRNHLELRWADPSRGLLDPMSANDSQLAGPISLTSQEFDSNPEGTATAQTVTTQKLPPRQASPPGFPFILPPELIVD